MGAEQQRACISEHTELGLSFLSQRQSSGLLKHPNIPGWHSLTCSPRASAALVNPVLQCGTIQGKATPDVQAGFTSLMYYGCKIQRSRKGQGIGTY